MSVQPRLVLLLVASFAVVTMATTTQQVPLDSTTTASVNTDDRRYNKMLPDPRLNKVQFASDDLPNKLPEDVDPG